MLPFPSKLTSPTCAPGSTNYFFGVINIENSGNPSSTIAAKQWAKGDVIVSGISYESGPGQVHLSFPGGPKVSAMPDPQTVYWLSPEFSSLWWLSFYFATWQTHQINIPLGFPSGEVRFRKWAGFIDYRDALTAENIQWQDSMEFSFLVSPSYARLPEFTVSNVRWVPDFVAPGTTAWLKGTYHSNIPAGYTPYVFAGPSQDMVNAMVDPALRSIRHPADAAWWQTGGGGSCCNCKGYPIPPPNGCSGQDTWTVLPDVAYTGFTPSVDGTIRHCVYCFNMPDGI